MVLRYLLSYSKIFIAFCKIELQVQVPVNSLPLAVGVVEAITGVVILTREFCHKFWCIEIESLLDLP